jgi:hypothetical protein
MAIVINGSGTVTGISVGGLPDGIVDSGTLATNSVDSAELIDGSIDTAHIAADQITSAILPTGSVLQVVSATYSTEVQTTSQSYSDTGLTATITPTSSSNKVLVIVNQNGLEKDNSDIKLQVKLLRGSSNILDFAGDQTGNTSSSLRTDIGGTGGTVLDSPSTTSATVYKTQFKNVSSSGTVSVNNGSAVSTITLQEIKG